MIIYNDYNPENYKTLENNKSVVLNACLGVNYCMDRACGIPKPVGKKIKIFASISEENWGLFPNWLEAPSGAVGFQLIPINSLFI